MFDNGFTRGYNTIYAENDQKQKSAHQKGTDKKDKPSQGEEIGKIGGEASALKEKLNLKLSRLKGLRMAINPQNAVPTVPEVTLMAQILKIDNYLEIIQRSVDKKDAVYQKDYYTAYNETYSAAQIKSLDNERARHENEMEGSDDNSKSAFQSGLSAGRGFGVAVYNARKKTVPPEDLPQKIEAAFQKAKDKGIYFNNGFTQGYNEKIEIGAAETRSENVSESQKAGLEALEAKKSNKKEGKIYFEKGREEGFDKWYDFSKKPEDERSESPDIKWQRKKENNNAEIIEDIEDDYKELKKEPVLSYQQLAQDFINGYEAGKYKGKIFGENFLEGYRAALNGSASNPGGKARYEEGYQEGKQKAQYKNFRDQALLTLSGTKATEKPVNSKQNTESDYFYQQGYQEHVNQWIKVYTIDSGLEVSESLNSVSIDPIENDKESKDNNAGIINLNTKQKARYFIKNQSNLIQKNLKKIEPEIIEAIKKRMSEKFNVSIDDLPLSRIEAEYKSSLANFKNGYENAIQFAKEKTEKEKNNNHIYHKGFLMGFKQGAAPLPQNLSERVKQQFLNLSETENPEDLRNSSYLQGKTRGFQISVQLKNNMIDSNEIIAEMAGPEYFSGYQKGSRKGNEAAERFKTNILKGKNTKMPKLDDIKERENMNGELLSGFDTGYQQSFEKKKAEIKASRIHPTD
jgi:hypothetical protein